MRRALIPAALSIVLLAAGCTADKPTPEPAPPVSAEPSVSATPLEGPAAQPFRYPDGLVVSLAKVERVPNAWGVDVPATQAIVRVTIVAKNEGTVAVPVVPSSRETTLLYGPNRQVAGSVTPYTCEGPTDRQCINSDEPERIAAGTSVTFVESSLVPAGELGTLTLRVELPASEGEREPFTFLDAHTVLKTVR